MTDAVAAAVAVWLVARYGVGMRLHTPGFGSTQRRTSLAAGFAPIPSAAASLMAWAVLKPIERTASRPLRAWIVTGLFRTRSLVKVRRTIDSYPFRDCFHGYMRWHGHRVSAVTRQLLRKLNGG